MPTGAARYWMSAVKGDGQDELDGTYLLDLVRVLEQILHLHLEVLDVVDVDGLHLLLHLLGRPLHRVDRGLCVLQR